MKNDKLVEEVLKQIAKERVQNLKDLGLACNIDSYKLAKAIHSGVVKLAIEAGRQALAKEVEKIAVFPDDKGIFESEMIISTKSWDYLKKKAGDGG